MTLIATRPATAVIVDPNLGDYALLEPLVRSGELDIVCFSRGRTALRSQRAFSADLWLVNADLPDIAGIDLCQMLTASETKGSIFFVGESYHPDDELAALQLGVAKYVCKPVHVDWLESLRRLRGAVF